MSRPLTAPSSAPTATVAIRAGSTAQCHWPIMKPNTMPDRLTIEPTDRSMPPRPETITTSSASASRQSGTIVSRAEAR